MGKVKRINIKNRTYYFYNNITDLKHFDTNFLKIDKTNYKEINIYYVGYIKITEIGEYKTIYNVNPLYLRINHASRYIEEQNGNKYLIFDSVDENKEVLKKYANVWDGIKHKIKAINAGKENHYEKDYMKIKFNSNGDLPSNKPLKFHLVTIIFRSVFKKTSTTTFFR